jgi:hypothetical protein
VGYASLRCMGFLSAVLKVADSVRCVIAMRWEEQKACQTSGRGGRRRRQGEPMTCAARERGAGARDVRYAEAHHEHRQRSCSQAAGVVKVLARAVTFHSNGADLALHLETPRMASPCKHSLRHECHGSAPVRSGGDQPP